METLDPRVRQRWDDLVKDRTRHSRMPDFELDTFEAELFEHVRKQSKWAPGTHDPRTEAPSWRDEAWEPIGWTPVGPPRPCERIPDRDSGPTPSLTKLLPSLAGTRCSLVPGGYRGSPSLMSTSPDFLSRPDSARCPNERLPWTAAGPDALDNALAVSAAAPTGLVPRCVVSAGAAADLAAASALSGEPPGGWPSREEQWLQAQERELQTDNWRLEVLRVEKRELGRAAVDLESEELQAFEREIQADLAASARKRASSATLGATRRAAAYLPPMDYPAKGGLTASCPFPTIPSALA